VNHNYLFDGQVESLTAREIEVLRLIAEGAGSRDIAARLGISYATVRSHIRSVGGKLGVHSKGEAVLKAKRLALIG
jgi:DNA-binding CsgD family transcriptional regulator